MNILYTSYCGFGVGGAEVSMSLLAKTLSKNHKIIIASTEEYKGFKTYKFSKAIKYVPSFWMQNNYMANFFSRVIKEESISIIHSHDSKTAIAAIMAAKMNGIKAVTHYRDYWFCCPKSSLLRPDLTNCEKCNIKYLKLCSKKSRFIWDAYKLDYLKKIRNVLNGADIKIAISKAVDEKLKMIGINDAKIIPNAIDLSMFRENKNDVNHEFEFTNIAYIGSLNYNKGLQNIIPVIKDILKEHKRARFTVAGEGELKEYLSNELKEFSERVVFCGNLDYADVIKLYNEVDIVLIPSAWQEPFSRVAIEAMAAGKAIIASNVGGLKDIIKSDFGYLIDANRTEEWKNVLEVLIDKPIKRRLMGINATKEAKKYDINAIARQVEKIYEGLDE